MNKSDYLPLYKLKNGVSTERNLAARLPSWLSNPALGSMCSEVTTVSVVLLFQTGRLNLMMRKHQQNPKWDPGSEAPAPTSQGLRSGRLLRLKSAEAQWVRCMGILTQPLFQKCTLLVTRECYNVTSLSVGSSLYIFVIYRFVCLGWDLSL